MIFFRIFALIMLKIHFAPIQGYTEDVYRRLHQEIFGGIDVYYTPFIRIEHGEVRSKDMRDVRPQFNEGVNVVPQVIASGADEFERLIATLRPLDYKRIDINMGCPFPLQTRHGRGAGLMANIDKVKEIADVISQNMDLQFSVKMRLGLNGSDNWTKVVEVLNNVPLIHIAVHPRIAAQQYKGELNMRAFEDLLQATKHDIIYNGDIKSVNDIKRIEEAYGEGISGVMIGRGLLSRPSLGAEYKANQPLCSSDLLEKIQLLHSRLLEHYQNIIPGEAQQLNKIRTFWDYMEDTIGRKQWKKIKKSGNMKNYLANTIF